MIILFRNFFSEFSRCRGRFLRGFWLVLRLEKKADGYRILSSSLQGTLPRHGWLPDRYHSIFSNNYHQYHSLRINTRLTSTTIITTKFLFSKNYFGNHPINQPVYKINVYNRRYDDYLVKVDGTDDLRFYKSNSMA